MILLDIVQSIVQSYKRLNLYQGRVQSWMTCVFWSPLIWYKSISLDEEYLAYLAANGISHSFRGLKLFLWKLVMMGVELLSCFLTYKMDMYDCWWDFAPLQNNKFENLYRPKFYIKKTLLLGKEERRKKKKKNWSNY